MPGGGIASDENTSRTDQYGDSQPERSRVERESSRISKTNINMKILESSRDDHFLHTLVLCRTAIVIVVHAFEDEVRKQISMKSSIFGRCFVVPVHYALLVLQSL